MKTLILWLAMAGMAGAQTLSVTYHASTTTAKGLVEFTNTWSFGQTWARSELKVAGGNMTTWLMAGRDSFWVLAPSVAPEVLKLANTEAEAKYPQQYSGVLQRTGQTKTLLGRSVAQYVVLSEGYRFEVWVDETQNLNYARFGALKLFEGGPGLMLHNRLNSLVLEANGTNPEGQLLFSLQATALNQEAPEPALPANLPVLTLQQVRERTQKQFDQQNPRK